MQTFLNPSVYISNRVLPLSSSWMSRFLVGLCLLSLLICSAKITLPLEPVPMTLQTLAILMIPLMSGWRMAFAVVMSYLCLGFCGLPVFASPYAGPALFLGPTAGYLLAFPIAAIMVGWTAEKLTAYRNVAILGASIIAMAFIYLLGFSWLSHLIGFKQAYFVGVKPFWFVDLLKCILAAFTAPLFWRVK